MFPANNIWNTPVDQLPVAPSSSAYINRMGSMASLHPDFGTVYQGAPNGTPFITVTGSQTKYPATFTYATESDPGPYPIPLNAPIEGGSQSTGDRHVIAIDTDNCILYELFAAYPQTASWQAGSGAIFNLNSNALRPDTWTSADAAGLPIFPGLVRYDEMLSGEIRHALRVTASQTQKAHVWPARHDALSITDPSYPPMGARCRLRADFDISGYSPTNQVILRALKKYGMIVADNGASWFVSGVPDSRWDDSDLHLLTNVNGSDFELVDVSSLMVDPNSGEARQNGVSVSVTPVSASVTVNGTQQFTAAVNNSTDQAVTWSVNGVAGGNPVTGWVSSTGRYTAPNTVPSPATVTVQAASQNTPSAAGTATITISAPAAPVSVSVSPSSMTLRPGSTQQFSASVNNSSDQTVTWSVNGVAGGNSIIGLIDSTGIYTAPKTAPSPATIAVQATSRNTPSAVGTATVTISAPPAAVKIWVIPATATVAAGTTQQFRAAVQNSNDYRVRWSVNGVAGGNSAVGTIGFTGLYQAPSFVSTNQRVTITAVSVADPTATSKASVTITPQ